MADTPAIELDRPLVAGWAAELELHLDVVTSLCGVYVPLAAWLDRRRAALGRSLVVGVNGAQGTGKSTLLWLMTRLLPQLHGLRTAGLSLDDLYLTAAERAELAARVHPLLRTRGVPGTHDLALGHEVLDRLTTGPVGSYAPPAFDKGLDDRAARASWPKVEVPVDVAILEGWCLGARPQGDQALASPCNALERERDPDGVWRRHVDQQLDGPYAAFFGRLDVLIMMKAPDMDCVRRWRIEQEHALSRRLRREGRPDTAMGDADVELFVQHFERVTREMLREMPERADVVIEIDRDHRLVDVRYRDGEGLQ